MIWHQVHNIYNSTYEGGERGCQINKTCTNKRPTYLNMDCKSGNISYKLYFTYCQPDRALLTMLALELVLFQLSKEKKISLLKPAKIEIMKPIKKKVLQNDFQTTCLCRKLRKQSCESYKIIYSLGLLSIPMSIQFQLQLQNYKIENLR